MNASYVPNAPSLSSTRRFTPRWIPPVFQQHTIRLAQPAVGGGRSASGSQRCGVTEHFGKFAPLQDRSKGAAGAGISRPPVPGLQPGQIGDGRGFLFAQLRDGQGRLLDLGTKGSGQTPWSRTGDGRLTLKGGVREIGGRPSMLEAPGVYTSKMFSLIETGEQLARNDEPRPTRSSVLVRLSHSHMRFGTFQRQAYAGDADAIGKPASNTASDTTIPDAGREPTWPRLPQGYARLLMRPRARGVAGWRAGFVHGVLNTDNMVGTGESFDYGPWRFLPCSDPSFTAAYFDETGLYVFGRQPSAALWNLARFAECLMLVCDVSPLEKELE